MVARSVRFSFLPSKILSDRRWALFPKSAVIPLNKWRIIHDLSWSAGHLINDSIRKDLFSCTYNTLDTAIASLKSFTQGALRVNLTYLTRSVTYLSSWPIEFDSSITTAYFVDAYRPFGLRSSPSLFLKFADSLADVMYSRGVFPVWYYLDNFWTCGPPAPDPLCSSNLQTMLRACSDLGFTTNPSKTIGPCTCLELLGIVLDSVAQEARISESRLREIIDLLLSWHSRKSCIKRQLQSLIGKLNFICFVCRPGRTFLWRLIDFLDSAHHPTHHVRLNKRSLKDICWWLKFLQAWNGRIFFYDEQWLSSACLHLYTDACNISFGGRFDRL